MTSILPNKGTDISPVKTKMNKSKIASDQTKDESRSFLSFSRENLSISHSDIEQGFNKIRPRIRWDTILSLIAIFLALFCIGLEIWKIQGVVDNAKEIEMLKHDVESMKHRLLEEDLLDELKAFEEMYAEESSEDDDVDSGDYDSVYEDDDDGEDEDDDEIRNDSKLSPQEYLSDYPSTPYASHTSGSGEAEVLSREDDLDKVLASLHLAEEKSVRENREKIEREFIDEEKQSGLENLEEDDDEDIEEDFSTDSDSSPIKRKRSVQKEKPLGYSSSGVPVYAHEYMFRSRKNSTKNSTRPRLSLYENLMNKEKTTTEKSKGQPLIHHAVITSWDKHPPKKYYAHSRPATSHVTPPASYTSRVHNPRQINARRSGGWRDERPQALTAGAEVAGETLKEEVQETSKLTSRPLRRRGMTRRHLQGSNRIVAAHYAADSNLFTENDDHVGNGKARHDQGVFKAWRPSNWMNDLETSQHFSLSSNGQLTVRVTGLYLIYAQIHYLDEHDENGFQVLLNDHSILQCMVYSPGMEHKSRSCFSAQAALLQSGDKLLLRDVAPGRYTLFQYDKSFFGLVKLGGTRLPRQQQQQQ